MLERAVSWQEMEEMRILATKQLENSGSNLCETADQSVTREDPPGCIPDMGCSILSPLHAWDSISFLPACDSSMRGVGGDNQCEIVKKKTNP